MQDVSQIGWPPEYQYRPSWEASFLVLYLLLVFVVGIVKAVRLGMRLWWFWPRRRDSLLQTDDENKKADLLAASALANRKLPPQFEMGASMPSLQIAESRLLYLWEMSSAEANSIKRLAVQTLLLSTLVLVTLTVRELTTIASARIYGIDAFAGGTARALPLFAGGVFVSLVLYAVYSLFEGILAHRRASWNYFCARVKN